MDTECPGSPFLHPEAAPYASVEHSCSQIPVRIRKPSTSQRVALLAVALAVLTAGYVITDGLPHVLAGVSLVALPVALSSTWPSDYSKSVLVALSLLVAAAATVIAWDDIDDRYGSVVRSPVGGGSDQIDFTLMSWTWAEHNLPGTTSGGEPAEQVVDWYRENSSRTNRSNLTDRWSELADRQDEPRTYAYRAHAYPILLGTTWKAIGYHPELGPPINAAMVGATAAILFLSISILSSVAGGLLASLSLMTINEPLIWAGQNLSETLSLLLAAGLVAALTRVFSRRTLVSLLALGALLGALALTKQLFLFVSVAFVAGLAPIIHRWSVRRTRTALGDTAIIAGVFLATIAPWFGYNIGTTGTTQLITGTSGWVDMPSSYSSDYLAGESRFDVRQHIFEEYEREIGRDLRSDVERALAGRQIWLHKLQSGDYTSRFFQLITLKAERTIEAGWPGHILRIGALAGLVSVVIRGTRPQKAVAVSAFLFVLLLLAVVAVTVEDGGRLFVTSWVMISAVAGLGFATLGLSASTEKAQAPSATELV